MRRRILSLLLAFVFCFSILPAAAFAGDGTDIAELAAGENGADAASVTKADGTETVNYASLTEALSKAEDGDTVTLLANHVTNWDAVDAGEELMAVVKTKITLNLNGFTVDYLVVGEVVPDEEGGILESTAGELTVVENSLSVGCIFGIQIEKGKLTIEGGEIGIAADTGSFICSDENGEVNINGGMVWYFGCEGGTANITGGKVYQLSVSGDGVVNISGGTNHGGWNDGTNYDTSTWSINGGTLNINGGTFGNIHFGFTGGNVNISGGIFQSISNSGVSTSTPVMSLLANGYAFYGKDEGGKYTAVQDGTKTVLENVKVLSHTDHTFVDGTCIACGALACEQGCIAHATILHYTWHFKTLQEIADQISGIEWIYLSYPSVTVKFLTDVTVTEPFTISKCSTHINLDLDGHKISGKLDTNPMIEVNFLYGAGSVNGVYILHCIAFQNGTIENTGSGEALRLSSGATTLENMNVVGDMALAYKFANSPNYTATFLGGGSFTKICPAANDEKGTWSRFLKDMLGTGCCFIDSAGNRVNADQRFGSNDNATIKALENVRVKTCDHKDDNGSYTLFEDANTSYGAPGKRCTVCGNFCTHDEITDDENLTCVVCGLPITVSATNLVEGIYYGPYYFTGLDDAVYDLRTVHGGRRPTVKLLADASATYGYEWWKDSDDGITIDLAGHDLTLSNNKANGWVKIQNTSDTHAEVHGTVNVNRDFGTATLTIPETDNDLMIDEVKIGTSGSASLAGGSFGKIFVEGEKTLASLPASGYYFADSTSGAPAAMYDADGNALTELTNVTVTKCSHDEAVCGPDGAWKCFCGQKTFVAGVTKGETMTCYTDLQTAFTAADGNTVKLLANAVDATVNTDKLFTLDLNGYTIHSLTVNSKITLTDSGETKGMIDKLKVSADGLTVGDLLEKGYAFKFANGNWMSNDQVTEETSITIQPAPIATVTLKAKDAVGEEVSTTMPYGTTGAVRLDAACGQPYGASQATCVITKIEGTAMMPVSNFPGYTLPADLAAGTHKYRVTFISDGYEKSAEITITVTPISIGGAEVTVKNPTYNGAEQSPAVTVKLGETVLTENKDYILSGTGSATDAGSYELTIVGMGGYNGRIENVKWRIEPKTVTNPTINVAPCVYDGSEQEPRVELKDGEKVIPEGEYTVAYLNNTDAGNGTVIINDVAGGNYVVSGSTTFPIEQDSIDEWRIRVEEHVFNELAKTYEIDLQTILDNILLEQYKDGGYGTVTYYHDAYGEVAFADYYDIGTAKIENGKLTLPIKNASGVKSGYDIGTLTIRVDSTNYKSFDLIIHIVARNKIVPMLNGIASASGITYGQTLSESNLTVNGSMEAPDINAPGNVQEIKGTFAWKDGTLRPDAGDYEAEWIFTPDEGYEEYAAATGKVTVKVSKADLSEGVDYTAPTVVTGLEYDGAEHELITKGSATIGTMEYKLGKDGSWSKEVPKAANAGSYEVYYRVAGGGNYNDTEEQKIQCSIAKRAVTISNKQEDGYKTEYMYGDIIFKPQKSEFEITGSEDGAEFSYQWIGEEPQMFSKLGDYKVKIIVGETANTAGGFLEIPVKIVRNTRNSGYTGGFDYIVYNNAGTVSYDIDYADGINPGGTVIDRETLKVKADGFNIVVRDANGVYIPYNKDNCDFKIAVTEGVTKGTVHIELTDLNKDITGLYFCMIAVQAANEQYENINVQLRLKVKDKEQQTLGVTMDDFAYGDNAAVPVYKKPEETLKTSVTYATKDGTKLTKAPTKVGSYTVTVVCETKDSIYSGLADYTINPRPIGDVSLAFENDEFAYNGSEQKAKVIAKLNGIGLVENTDYTVMYPTDATNVGEKRMTVTGIGNFSGTTELVYTITPCITAPTVELSQTEYTYDGNEKKPLATVSVNNTVITEGKDYEVSYKNNKNAGTASVIITSKGNYGFSEFEKKFTINKANIKVKPKDVTKTYGKEAVFALEYNSELITYEELIQVTDPAFTSDGAAANAPVNETGYEISVLLTNNETDNLTFEVDGKGTLKIEKAPLTIKVNNVNREYGAENPELTVSYDGFVNGEDESVLSGELKLSYDNVDKTTAVGTYTGAAKAEGQTSGNYEITYVDGDVEIVKIPVNISAQTATETYLTIELDRAVEGLGQANFEIKDSDGNSVSLTNVIAAPGNQIYTLRGRFTAGREYTVKITLSGIAADETHRLVNDELVITPVRTNSGGSGGFTTYYTVSFETNGADKISSRNVSKNSVIKEPAAPEKEGYDFAGWYTDKELKEKYDFSSKVTKSFTLYAAWTKKDDLQNQIILTIGKKEAQVFGETKTNDVAPQIVNDRTMLPARFVAENLGADVSWNGEKQLVTITGKHLKTGEDVVILITIGEQSALVNGSEVKLDSPAFVENNRTYTPIRFISEQLGADVEWIAEKQQVVITK